VVAIGGKDGATSPRRRVRKRRKRRKRSRSIVRSTVSMASRYAVSDTICCTVLYRAHYVQAVTDTVTLTLTDAR
jgi:hypothetical protein